MKLEVEEIKTSPEESFKLRWFEGEPGCMDDYWHVHPEYEIVYVHNGSGRRHIGTHISQYHDGVFLFLGPNIPHLPLSNQSKPDNFEVVVQFTDEFISQKLAAFPEFAAIQDLKRRSLSGISFGKVTKEKVLPYIKPDAKMTSSQKLLWLLTVLNDLAQAKDYELLNAYGAFTDKSQMDYDRVRTIFKKVSEQYSKEISLDDLADQVGLTKNSLCRFFKKTTGKTIIDYLNEYRIGIAKEHLADGSHTVSEVLYKCGFNDPSFFYKKFKQVTGVSPKTFQVEFISRNHHIHQRNDRTHPHY